MKDEANTSMELREGGWGRGRGRRGEAPYLREPPFGPRDDDEATLAKEIGLLAAVARGRAPFGPLLDRYQTHVVGE